MLEAAGTFWILDVGFRLETCMNEHYIRLAHPRSTVGADCTALECAQIHISTIRAEIAM